MGSYRALAIVLTLVPGVALAQPTDKQRAGELTKKAIAKGQAGDHEEAIKLYEQAYNLSPAPMLLSNIGSEFQHLKKPVEARAYFCKYLDKDPNGSVVGFATAQAKSLYLELSGASSVDDKDVCKPIVKSAPPPPPMPVAAPAPAPEAPPVADQPAHKGPKTTSLRYAGYAVTGIGAVGFAVGIVYGVKAYNISNKINNHDPTKAWDANIRAQELDGQKAEKMQIGFMVGGGLALAGGVAMIMLGAAKPVATEQSVAIAPVATPDSLGFAAFGRF